MSNNEKRKTSYSRALPDEANIHSGHRERMFEQLEKNRKSLNEHQVLEILLYFALRRIDTNVISHRLINKFGSFKNVFAASEKELMQVRGVGEKTAQFIKEVSEIITDMSMPDEPLRFENFERFSEFCKSFASTELTADAVFLNGKTSICKMNPLETDLEKYWELDAPEIGMILNTSPVEYMLVIAFSGKPTDRIYTVADFYERYFEQFGISHIETVFVSDGELFQYSKMNILIPNSGGKKKQVVNVHPYNDTVYEQSVIHRLESNITNGKSGNYYYSFNDAQTHIPDFIDLGRNIGSDKNKP